MGFVAVVVRSAQVAAFWRDVALTLLPKVLRPSPLTGMM